MKNKNGLLILGASFSVLALSGFFFRKPIKTKINDKIKLDFINKILPHAQSIGAKIGVPPLFILSQLALESAWGKSKLTSKYNNFGGIKAVNKQPFIILPTKELINGTLKTVNQKFAVFPSIREGLEAQARIYQNKNFKQYLNKTTNPIHYAKLLQSKPPRYATAPNYVNAIENTLNEIKRVKSL